MPARLSVEQVESYERDGFLAPVRVASPDEAAAWRRELEDAECKHGRLHYVSKAHLLLDFAYRLATHSSVLDTVSSIIGPDILLWDSTFIIKEPGDGKKVSWHQDLTYWGLDPDRLPLAGAVAGDDRERLHGYDPWIAQGSHRCPP